jgi:hypothetical protein
LIAYHLHDDLDFRSASLLNARWTRFGADNSANAGGANLRERAAYDPMRARPL